MNEFEHTEYPQGENDTPADSVEESAVAVAPKRGRGRPAKYDWDTIFSGDEWRSAASDLHTTAENFRSLVHTTAKRRGIKASTTIKDGVISVKKLTADGAVSD